MDQSLKFTEDHEWVKIEGNRAYIGISDYAQHAMGDVVFVELPQAGQEIKKGGPLGVVESFKSTSDILSPVSGKVLEINQELSDKPEKLNEAPYEAWIAVLETGDEVDELMSPSDYEEYVKTIA